MFHQKKKKPSVSANTMILAQRYKNHSYVWSTLDYIINSCYYDLKNQRPCAMYCSRQCDNRGNLNFSLSVSAVVSCTSLWGICSGNPQPRQEKLTFLEPSNWVKVNEPCINLFAQQSIIVQSFKGIT